MTEELNLTDQNFDQIIQTTDKLILVDFWAQWCQPCFTLTPILEKVAKEFKEEIILAKVNLENARRVGQKLGINKIPTVVLFKQGKPAGRFVGARPEPVVRDIINQMLKDSEKEAGGMKNIIKNYQKYAEKNGFKLNPDQKAIKRIVKGLLENEKKYGARYCPCREVVGNLEEDKSKICPCKWHLEEIEKNSQCFCGLFVKKMGIGKLIWLKINFFIKYFFANWRK